MLVSLISTIQWLLLCLLVAFLPADKDRMRWESYQSLHYYWKRHIIFSAQRNYAKGMAGVCFHRLAREGRSFKLGFVLVHSNQMWGALTCRSWRLSIQLWAFNMPFDDARHSSNVWSGFAGLELEISNAPEFRGVAIADEALVFFQSSPVDENYMKVCADGLLRRPSRNKEIAELSSENEEKRNKNKQRLP